MKIDLSFAEWMGLLTAAGILASFGLSLYIWLRHSRPSRKVEVRLDFLPALGWGEKFIWVTFVNERGSYVIIEGMGFAYADGSKKEMAGYSPTVHSDSLPKGVSCGDSAKSFYGIEQMRRDVQKGAPVPVKAYCRDRTGHFYETPLSQEIRSALRMPPKGSNPGAEGGIEASAGPPILTGSLWERLHSRSIV